MSATAEPVIQISRLLLRMLGRNVTSTGSLAKNLRMCREKIKWSISGKVIGLEAKSPRNVVKMKEEMTAFFHNGL